MATKKTKTGHGWQVHTICFGDICIPVGFNAPSNAAVPDAGGAIGGAIGGDITKGLQNAVSGIWDDVWNKGRNNAVLWVIGGAMVFVFIAAAKRIGSGG